MDSQSEKAEREESRLQFNKQLFKTYLALDHWHRFRLRLFLEGILVGIAGGLLIALFRFLLGLADTYRRRLFQEIIIPSFGISDFLPLLWWLAALFFIGGALYVMCRYAPMASGSGIPQVKGVILGFFKMKWFRILWVKITAGALGIGAGLSLGREGPSIQIGAVAAQGLSRFMGRTRMEERYLITSGASAGLAAAFNAPLAGTMFALEELHRNFSGAVLLPTMASAISATIVSQFFFGSATSFSFPLLVHLPSEYLWCVVLIAVSCGFAGIVFNYGLLHMDAFYGLPVFRNQYMKSCLPSLQRRFLLSHCPMSWAEEISWSIRWQKHGTASDSLRRFFWQNFFSPSSVTAVAFLAVFPASSRHRRSHRLPGGGTPHLCRHFIRPLPAKHYYHCHGRFLCRQYPCSHYGDAPHSGNDR